MAKSKKEEKSERRKVRKSATQEAVRPKGTASTGFATMQAKFEALNLGKLPNQELPPALVSIVGIQRGDGVRNVYVYGEREIPPETNPDGSAHLPKRTFYCAPVDRKLPEYELIRSQTEEYEAELIRAFQFGRSERKSPIEFTAKQISEHKQVLAASLAAIEALRSGTIDGSTVERPNRKLARVREAASG